ncbi:hypothetical protein RS022_04920 [Candidatus Phytoplasma rubi]|uniref:Effector n=1 Tax=Candidatus Phytoplasma rubi TaxID=399025 RepID=A0ABY7BSC2_9MOLU|nr:hypothetical protein [Candidatus Phytoplasma rubi]WAN63379.1 hypothetical protein RS022_04920 [Candidatus Phytoplasma rubi]
MNISNFLKKHLSIIIIISIFVIIVIFWFYQSANNSQQNKEKMSHLELKSEEIKLLELKSEESKPQKNKYETKKPKFSTTQTYFDQIKNYIFQETDDKFLLPNDISESEQKSIEKIKNSSKLSLNSLKENQNQIIKENEKCYNLKKQFHKLQLQKEILKGQLKQKELELKILDNILSRDEDYRKTLEEKYKNNETQYKNSILSELNSIYEIDN